MTKNEERLNEWVNSLTIEQLKFALIETTTILMEFDEVSYYDHHKSPIWSNTGDYIDGTDRVNEE